MTPLLLTIILSLAALPQRSSAQPAPGILGTQAPSWSGVEWVQLDGRNSLDVKDLRGKVIYLYYFQSWCPGCHSHGFPTLQLLIDRFAGDPDVAFVAIQTTFEGFASNTSERAKEMAERYELDIPIGHDGDRHTGSVLMRRYQTGGTPWTVIIDRDGVVRFNQFFLEYPDAVKLIEHLKPASTQSVG